MNELWNPNELYHHGIKGQKWGVRRFENYDGTLTQAGKDRYGYKNTERRGSNNKNSIKDFYHKHKKAINTTAAIAATALLAYGAYKVANIDGGLVDVGRNALSNINTDELIGTVKELGNKAGNLLKETGKKAGKAAGDAGVRAAKAAGKSLAKGTDAAISAAMATAGSIAILKIAEKYAPDDSDSETVKNVKKIAVESATAAINAATNANASTNKNNNNSNKGGSVGKEVTEAIGAPSNKGIDKSSARYQALFKDSNGNQRDADTRAIIKSMASAGYDIEQIEQYLELKHSYMFGGLYHSDIWNPDVLCHSDTVFGAENQNGKSELYHHGIKGQKWGVRRFENYDGTLTQAGKDRYGISDKKETIHKNVNFSVASKKAERSENKARKKNGLTDKQKKLVIAGAAIAATGLAVYGAYRLNKDINSKNLMLATQAGQELSYKMHEDIRPKIMGPGSVGHHRYSLGNEISMKMMPGFAEQATNKILQDNNTIVKKTKNALYMNKVVKGEAIASDLFSYDEIANHIYDSNKVAEGGDSWFARAARDVLNMGGKYPNQYVATIRSRYPGA